jgi:molybdopterin converting factor small subunit
MPVTVHYRGQLSTAMGADSEEIELGQNESIQSLLQGLAKRGSKDFADIVLDDDGAPRRTLLVAVDGQQVVGLDELLDTGVHEITLIPPISGG